MGFSLVGNSGDSSTSSTTFVTNYSASNNPQADLQGSGAGAIAAIFAPLLQGSTLNGYSPQFSSNYSPVNVVQTGENLGDSALAALAQISGSQYAASEAPGTSDSSTGTGFLASLLQGNTIYIVLGGIVLLFLAHKK